MKQLVIQQKYFTIGDKFEIANENGQRMFWAQEEIMQLRKNCNLFDAAGMLLYRLEARFLHMFTFFAVLTGNGNEVGAVDERIHFPKFKRARFTNDKENIYIKAGPIHLKAYVVNDKWKFDRKQPVVRITKKLMKIADKYIIEYDDTAIPASIAALVGLWYDICHHKKH